MTISDVPTNHRCAIRAGAWSWRAFWWRCSFFGLRPLWPCRLSGRTAAPARLVDRLISNASTLSFPARLAAGPVYNDAMVGSGQGAFCCAGFWLLQHPRRGSLSRKRPATLRGLHPSGMRMDGHGHGGDRNHRQFVVRPPPRGSRSASRSTARRAAASSSLPRSRPYRCHRASPGRC